MAFYLCGETSPTTLALPTISTISNSSIASFDTDRTEDLVDCIVDVNAIQDLHGYSYPWVGGAGKNIIGLQPRSEKTNQGVKSTVYDDNRIVGSGESTGNGDIGIEFVSDLILTSGISYTLSLTGIDTRTGSFSIFFHIKNGSYTSPKGMGANVHSTTFNDLDGTFDRILFRTSNENTVTVDAKLMLEVGSSPTAFEPYSNICPITGHTESNVVRCGVNICSSTFELGYYSTTGVKTSADNQLRTANMFRVKPNTTYYFKAPISSGSNLFGVCEYNQNGTFLRRNNTGYYSGDGLTYTTSNDCYFLNVNIGSGYGNTDNNDISINYPSTDTSYHAYTGQTYTTEFGQTVYGGKLNIDTGELEINKALIDNSTIGIQKNSSSADDYMYYMGLSNHDRIAIEKYMCSHVKRITTLPIGTQAGFMFYNTYNVLYFNMGVIADNTSSGMRQYLIDNNVQFIYPLATPTILHLTPQQVNTLLGQNNIYADTGNINTLKYVETLSNKYL